MTREEAINEINEVFTPAYANYIVTALTEGATASDIQHRWGQAIEDAEALNAINLDLADENEDLVERIGKLIGYIDFLRNTAQGKKKSLNLLEKVVKGELEEIRAEGENFVKPRTGEWIPVTERLPKEKTAVLLSCDDMYLAKLNPCIGWINGNNWHTFSARGSYLVKYPIAWMPLPQPYKAESEDK